MKPPDRQRHRLAQYILQQLERRDRAEPERLCSRLGDIQELFGQLQSTARRLDHCSRKGWQVATKIQMEAVSQWISDLVSRATELQGIANAPSRPEPPSLREVLDELVQLEAEFDHVEFHARNHTISVAIEPVTLKDVYLGPFKVELDLRSLSRRERAYKVIAEDPHPASSNENTTHPHVRDEELCEGDATAGVASALRAGRLCDFFTLVRSVLTTYNSASPYVALDSWDGIACHDCGYVTGDDDRSYCDGCDHDFCGDCMSYCRQCDESRCRGCLEDCSACEEPTCSKCSSECRGCRKFTCDGCLEDDLCPACREKDEEDDGEPETAGLIAGISVVTTNAAPPSSRRWRRRNRHRAIAA